MLSMFGLGKEQVARAVGGLMRSDGSPCVATFKDGKYQLNDCSFMRRIEKTEIATKKTSVSKLLRYDAKNLVSDLSGRFYGSGEVTMRVNNWDRPMTYQKETLSPTYSLTMMA